MKGMCRAEPRGGELATGYESIQTVVIGGRGGVMVGLGLMNVGLIY